MATITSRTLGRDPILWAACGFGAGLAPRAPGTFGTLVAVPLQLVLALLPLLWQGVLVALVIAVGGAICAHAAHTFGEHDHPCIVWDEIAGYLLTMLLLPSGLWWLLAGFLAFRLFDIVKPWPIGWLDAQVPGGWGIMLDDLAAALLAAGLLRVLHQMSNVL